MASEVKSNKISPATGTNFTFGDSGDTFTIPSGATIANSGTATGFGKVLQVVQTVKTDTFSRASTGGDYGDITGLSVTITPTATSSKVLVFATVMHGSANGQENFIKLVRNSSDLFIGNADGSRKRASSSGRISNQVHHINASIMFLDTPGSTSPTIYKIQGGAEGTNTIYINRPGYDADSDTIPRTASQITVMEVGV